MFTVRKREPDQCTVGRRVLLGIKVGWVKKRNGLEGKEHSSEKRTVSCIILFLRNMYYLFHRLRIFQ